MCACNKYNPAVTFYMLSCKRQLVPQVFSKAEQGDCCWRDLPCFITKDGYSLFLCCLLKFKMQVTNSENIKAILAASLFQQHRMGVTQTRAMSDTSHLTSCPPILSPLPLRGALHSSLPAHHGISFTPQTRLRGAENHLRETEGIIRLCFFPSDPRKASQASLSSARKKSLLPLLCTH